MGWGKKILMMQTDNIKSIEIDREGKLHVVTDMTTYPMIYRTATEVHWDVDKHSLYSPKPREWSYIKWYNHILDVCETECSCRLLLTAETTWVNVPDELRDEMRKR
ncbi:hypothetical protein CLV93_11820 [Prolixibacter denitrificans]|nr:hypothetical protein CLV93_11820 [Prolixibacter denitrificans]